MKIKLSGVGKIDDAEIALDGLTVIAGENNTGKSTVGKLIFSIVKALSRYEQDLNENKSKQIFDDIERLYFRLRRFHEPKEDKVNLLRSEFYPPKFFDELKPYFDPQLNLFENSEDHLIGTLFERKINALKRMDLSDNAVRFASDVLLEMQRRLSTKEDINEVIKRALSKAFVSEFYFEISPKNSPLFKSTVSITEGSQPLLNFEISNNHIVKIDVGEKIGFDDATLIDSPIILQMSEVIQAASTLFELENTNDKNARLNLVDRPRVPLHQKDLISKMKEAEYFSFDTSGVATTDSVREERKARVVSTINRIIDGVFSYEKENSDFIYSLRNETGSESKIRSLNTASGLKSFGIIQLLATANRLDERSLIIIDEPETHLHPRWQIEYARLLVELVKLNCCLLITTHSPYFLQAIKVFSEDLDLEGRVNYYAAESFMSKTRIDNVNSDLNRIFKKLSDPLQNIVWNR